MAERRGSLPFDVADPVLAAAAWSRLVEPGDAAAGALVRAVGTSEALDWLRSGAATPPGALPHRGWISAAERWRPRLAGLDPRRELDVITRRGGRLLLPGAPGWPTGLDDLGDASPMCLWVIGACDPDVLTARAVALVGARASTAYGDAVTADLAAGLAQRGIGVISGGAFGIDACAHRVALACDGAVLAVMAGGLDRYYPRENVPLLEEVAAVGAVVSEAPPGTSPMRQRFLARNRLIAALAGATVVVEAAWRSGALSTARHAAELLRPVGAVPGPVTSAASAGCHRLLREGAATCVTDVGEVVELVAGLQEPGDPDPLVQPGLLDDLAPDHARLLDAMPVRAAATTDGLVRSSGLGPSATLAALGALELAGRVERDGQGWRRVRA
jgi:DNA processing protein